MVITIQNIDQYVSKTSLQVFSQQCDFHVIPLFHLYIRAMHAMFDDYYSDFVSVSDFQPASKQSINSHVHVYTCGTVRISSPMEGSEFDGK